MPSAFARHFTIDPSVTFLNHGSFGACPREVQAAQTELRAHMEAEPIRFFLRELEGRLDASRAALGPFVGADPAGIAFVRNASEGVSTVLARYPLKPGDAVITTDHAYAACKNALDDVALQRGAEVIVARVPFPIARADDVLAAIDAAMKPNVRLAMIDHVTSPTGVVFPVEEIVAELQRRGVDCLIDGAHAPGMLDLDVRAIGAAYYTGNCHKWMCAPKGAAFLWVREDKRKEVRPLVLSHGARSSRADRSRFHLEFDWTGTQDLSPALCVPVAIEAMAKILPWPQIRAHNRALALEARRLLVDAVGGEVCAPEDMIGSLATIALPDGEPLADRLFFDHAIEVPSFPWPAPPKRWLRIAAQIYNDRADYERLASVLRTLL